MIDTFPTKVLLATDGSEEAILAERAAARLATTRDSELHVVHLGEFLPTFLAQTEVEPARLEREAMALLEERAARIEAGGKAVALTHLGRCGQGDRRRRRRAGG